MRVRPSLAWLTVAAAALAAPPAAGQVVLLGTVTDSTNRPLANVRVRLDSLADVTTDLDGLFFIADVFEGRHVLRFERIGVQPRFLRLDVPAGSGSSMDVGVVLLDVLATTLEEIVVRAPRYEMDIPGHRELQQLQRAGYGHLITAEEIDRMNPADVRDVIRRMPGVNVGGSQVSFWGGGQLSCPRGASFVIDGVRSYTLNFINDPERQIRSMWSYRGAFERCGVIVVETNQIETEDGSPGVVGIRFSGTSRRGDIQVERVGVFLSLPVSELLEFYPAGEARRGRRQGWNLQLAMKVLPFRSIPAYVGGGVMVGKDEPASNFGPRDISTVPLLLAGVGLPVLRLRLIGELQVQDPFTGGGRQVSALAGLGFRFGSQ